MRVRFLSAAEDELDEAASYYHTISPRLGARFLQEAAATRDLIRQHPFAWHPVDEVFRKCRFHRFPYAFIYEVRQADIIIVAVAHLKRQPDYWRPRDEP